MKLRILILLGLIQSHLSGQNLIVQATSTNVLYIGLDNELLIRYKGIKDGDLMVKTDNNGTIRHVKEAAYIATVNAGAKICKIYIGLKKEKGRKWLDSIEMDIRTIPKPVVRFGNLESGSRTIKELLEQDSMTCGLNIYIKKINYWVSKYRVIIMPKRGVMTEYTQLGSIIGDNIKRAIAGCDEGDLLVIDEIRVIGPYGERRVESFIISIKNYRESEESFGNKRITGYYRDSGQLKFYKFPIMKDQVDCSYKLSKDSVWTYWTYNSLKKDFLKASTDSFKDKRLIKSTYFSDSSEIKEYDLKKLTDSTFFYTSYFPNGNIYQKGVVRINSPTMKFHKYYFYEAEYTHSKREIWNECLESSPSDLYPIGFWSMYDSERNIKIQLEYKMFLDSFPPIVCNFINFDLEDYDSPQYFYIVPQGPCTIYEKGKVKEIIIFKDGKIESRK